MRKTSSFVLPSAATVNLQKHIVDALLVPRSIKFGRLGYRHYFFDARAERSLDGSDFLF